jgi:hypothetical protein
VPVTPVEAAVAFFVITCGAVVQGSVGFGAALVAGPFLLLLDRSFLPGPMVLAGTTLGAMMGLREWHAVNRPGVAVALGGRLIGLTPAVLLMGLLSDAQFAIACATIILAAVVVSVAGWHVKPTLRNTFIAGAISGFTGTLAAIGGPPMALLYQHETGDRLRGTIAVFFFLGGILSIVALALSGHFGLRELALSAVLLPGVVVGFLLSRFTAPLLDAGQTRPAVLVVSTAAAVLVLCQALI